MLKKKFGGGLLFAYVKEKKWEMDAKSGSVLPTTPRKERYSHSEGWRAQSFGRQNDKLALASQRSVPGERTPAIAGLKCRILLTCFLD